MVSDIITDTCTVCGTNLVVTERAIKERAKRSAEFRCRSCVAKNIWKNFTNDDKAKRSENLSRSLENYWTNLPDVEKSNRVTMLRDYNNEYWDSYFNSGGDSVRSEKIRTGLKNYWNKLPDDEKAKKLNALTTGYAEWWNSLSDEDRIVRSDKIKDYWNNRSDEDIQKHSDRIKNYWKNISDEERTKVSERVSVVIKEYYKNLPEAEKIALANATGERSKKWWSNLSKEKRSEMSEKNRIKARNYWDNMTSEQYDELSRKRAIGYNKYLLTLGDAPNKNELEFMNRLKLLKFTYSQIEYQWQYTSQIKYPEFDILFPINPVTDSKVSYQHNWDFMVHTGNKSILIDVDGSIHALLPGQFMDGNIDVGAYIQFNDSKRPYQTDGYDAYIVLCYDNKLTDDTPVLSFQSGEMMTVKQLIALLTPLSDKRQ